MFKNFVVISALGFASQNSEDTLDPEKVRCFNHRENAEKYCDGSNAVIEVTAELASALACNWKLDDIHFELWGHTLAEA